MLGQRVSLIGLALKVTSDSIEQIVLSCQILWQQCPFLSMFIFILEVRSMSISDVSRARRYR